MLKAVAILVLYAALVLVMGALAFASAPEGANKITALIFPGLIAAVSLACVVMSLFINKKRTVGMIGIHLGIVFPLLVAVAVGHRGYKVHQDSVQYGEAVELWDQRVQEGAISTPEARERFFEEGNYPEYDKAYLRTALFAISAISLITFVAMIAARPKPPARKPATEAPAESA
ncbi:MAG: hypothetical protein AAFV77_04190 [Planctomycetota bacterium]